MGSPENLGTNGGILPSSLLESASLGAALDDNSALTSLQIALRTPSGSDPITSELEHQQKSQNATENNFSNQDTTNYTTLGNNIFDSGQSFKQPQSFTSTPILPISNNNQNSNKTKAKDSLTGNTTDNSLVGITEQKPLIAIGALGNLDNSQQNSSVSSSSARTSSVSTFSTSQTSTPSFAIRTEGTISINNNGDFDGIPTDLSDDALIYAAKGFIMNGNLELPVQRDAQGNPIRDSNGKLVLVDKAVAVSNGYTTSIANGSNSKYAGLVPPPVVAQQTVFVPAYADIKQVDLNRRIPTGTPTVTFNISQNPLNTSSDWSQKFPAAGTVNNPTVVRVIGGGLNIPANVNLSNYVITVEQGDINFNGNNYNINNVALVTNNGNINLANVLSRDLSVFASGSINMNGGARFAGNSMLATGSSSGNITFNGATASTNSTDNLKVISQGDITYNGASNTRGLFLSVKNFTFNGISTLYGSISAKGNIVFNGQATVIAVADLMPDITPPAITATLAGDTAPNGQTNQDLITFDPKITGTVTDNNPIVEFRAGFNNTPSANYTSVMQGPNSDGSFSFTRSQLETIYGGTLSDGVYTLHLQAKDLYGNLSETFNVTFTLDTTTLSPNNLDLLTVDDSGVSNTDNLTNKNTPHITGNAEIGAVVQLFNNGQLLGQATANNTGAWQIVTSSLTDGTYNITARSTDIAGNVSNLSTALNVTIDSALPLLTLNTPVDTTPLTPGARLTGSVDGTGSPVTALSYYFDNLASVIVPFNATGAFDQSLDLTGLSNGTHTLTISATDTAGNIKTTQYHVTVVIDQLAPVITASLLHDTAPNGQTNSDTITFDPTIIGTVIDASRVVEFKAAFDSTQPANFVNVLAQRIASGSFTFTRTQLEQIYGATLPDGLHTLHLQAVDEFHNVSNIFNLSFTFDTTTSEPIFNLNAVSDSGVIGDFKTKFDTVTLTGLAEANSTVILQQTGAVTTSDNNGQFTFTHVSLAIGDNSLIARSTDTAGNQNIHSTNIYRFSPPTAINLAGNTVAENSSTGTVIGQLSSIDPDAGDIHTYTLEDNAGGRFRIVGNQLQVADGTLLNFESSTQHSVTITSTDANGLRIAQVFAIAVKNVNEAPSFTSTPISKSNGGSLYTYNIIAADPDAGDTLRFTTNNLPSWLTLADNLDGTATLRGTPTNFLDNINSNIHLSVTDASGLTAIQDFTITPTTTLVEQSNFTPTRSLSLKIPATPSILSFKIDPQFDTTSVNSINDAIEVALIDALGNSLVHTVDNNRDAFFNWTEGESTVGGAGTSYDAATGIVSLNLTGITPGTKAQLVFRLVNNDGDVTTNVRVTDFALTTAPDGTQTPVQTNFGTPTSRSTPPNFNLLTDVGSSTGIEYHRTSFNADTHLLYADIALHNIGSYSVNSSLIVAINHISDPTVLVRNPDGFTPDGLPYYDFSKLLGDTKFDPNELTQQRTFVFYNPQGVQFTYDLTVLAALNAAPVIQTQPNKEVIGGHYYSYHVDATDPNGDSLTYKLLTAPDGMTIDQITGLISWNTTASNIGNSSVLVEVGDGHGGVVQQQFTLSVIDAPPNRPPIFTSTPVVNAVINNKYIYQVQATDSDDDSLTFSLLNSPIGMTINGDTGEINWIPTAISLTPTDLTVRVTDSHGDFAEQSFNINVQPESGNHSPIIFSEPVTKVNVFNSISQPDSQYSYSVQAIDPDNDLLNYSLVRSPTGMKIDAITGNITWANPVASTTPYDVTVQVQDSRGGVNTQSYQLSVTNNLPGKIYGSVFQDLDENGIRGGSGILLPNDPNIKIDPYYANNYSAYDIDRPASISQLYINGPVFKPLDPNTLTVMTGGVSRGDDRIYEIKVIRGEGDHIIGFGEANLVLKLGDSNNGLFAYAPNGTLFTGRYDNTFWQTKPGSTKADKVIDFNQLGLPFITGIEIVPSGLPGEGQLKLVSWPNGAVYTAKLIPDGIGTYNIESPKLEAVAGYASYNLNYIPVSSPLFDVPSTLVGEYRSILWSTDGRRTSAYEIDGNGNPILLTRRDFIQNINPAGGSFDPITGDYVSLVQQSSPLPTGDLIVVRGFNPIAPTEIGIPDSLVYIDSNNNGRRNSNETFTIADDKGNYSFTLDPGSYKISLDLQSGWAFTGTTNGSYSVNLASGQVVSKQDFGITNNRLNGAPNLDPTFVSIPPTVATSGEQFLYRAKATDLNGDILEYDLSIKPSGMVVSPQGIVSWMPNADQVGVHNVLLRVQDGYGGVNLQSFQVVVSLGNTAPIFTTSTPIDYQPQIGQLFQYQAQAMDADGDTITYRLLTNPYTAVGATVDSSTGLVRWTPDGSQLGRPHPYVTWQIIIAANDGHGGEIFQIINFQDVVNSATNNAPVITSTPPQSIALGQTYFYIVQASDPNYDSLTYSLENAPQGMTIDSQARIVWQPQPTQVGSNPVTLKVDDGRGGVITQAFNIDVVSSTIRTNNAPTITSTPNLVTNLERTYAYNLTGSDPDNDLLLWSLDSSPTGMVIDPQSGALRWQPKADQIGKHTVTVRLTDAYGLYAAQEFTLHVTGVNTPSAIVSNPITKAAQNQLYTYTVVATDPENDPLTFSLGRKPAGMTIDNNGTIQWTPQSNQIGSQQVEVFARDAQGAVTTQTFTIEVGATAINTAPSITSTPVYLAAVGSPYQYQVVATDPDAGDRLTYQLLSVPAGLTGITIDPNTGLLTWANPVAGNYKVVVGAVDAAGLGAAQGFTLTARENHAPVIKSNLLLTATPGSTYSYDVIASDVDGDRLTYSLDQTSRNLGMMLDTLGRVRWNPTANNVGSHTVVITINDGNGGTQQQQYNLSVAADTEAPKVRLIANYDSVNLGESITFQARATDNIKVAGLQLLIDGTAVVLDSNGMARFTPTTAGTIIAKVIATDSAGNTGQATFNVAVIDTSDVNAPDVSLNLGAIAQGTVTAPVDIKGTVSDDNLDFYRLLVAPIGSSDFKEIFRGTSTVNNDVLGKFDPSLLENDSYTLRLEAHDKGGNVSFVEDTVNVSGELKLGNFRLSFTDLSIPVTGIPITLTRTYDSLTSGTTDDFGYGWRMEFRDTDLRTSVGKPTGEVAELGGQNPFKDGTKVYVTLPGGKREGFTFKPTIDPLSQYLRGAGGVDSDPNIYHPSFVADAGVTDTLTVQNTRIIHGAGTSQYYGLGGSAYNPADTYFGGVYTLTTKEGIVYQIDAATGDLLTVTDTNGNKLTYTDADITSSTGQKITFGRDAQGRIATVTDPAGKQIRYEYNAKGDLVSVTDRENNTTRMEYDQERSHYLDKIIDPLGRTGVKNEYGDDGRLKKMVDAAGASVQLAYDPSHSTETITDALGHPTTYEYDERGNVVTGIDALGGIKKRTYDENNNLLSQTDPQGNTYIYTYDNANNLTSVTDPLGNTTRYSFNKFGEVLTKTNPLGNTTTYVYNNQGNRLSLTNAEGSSIKYSFDAKGRPNSITGVDGSVTQFQYDSLGNLTTEIDALGHQTTYTYDSSGNQLSETKTVTLPNGLTTLTTRWTYDANNRVTSITDAAGNITRQEYDQLGNLSASIDTLGHRTEYIYDAKGKQIKTLYADGTVEQAVYDAAGQEIATIDQAGNSTNFVYDALGRLIKTIYADTTPDDLTDNPTTSTEYDIAGHITARIDERGNRTQYQYDADGRPTVVEDALGNKTTYTYNAANNRLSETDALNHITQYSYDALGRKIGTKLADGTTTSMTYDSVGRRNSSTDQANRTTRYVYDSLSRITEVIDPMGYHTTSAYDEAGRLISQIDANNHTTKYEYDTLGRRTALIDALDNKTTYTYNAVGNKLSETDALNHTTQIIYDIMNRPVETIFADGSHMDMTYDVLGQEIAMTDQMGMTTHYEYDVLGRLISVLDALEQRTSYSYDQSGDLISQTDTNGHITNYQYDALNRRTATILPLGQRSTTNYDAVGNVLSTTDANGHTINYQYDAVDQLTQEQFADRSKVNYTYTVTGKIATVSDSRGVTSYTYDSKDRLLSQSDPDGQKIQYTYDAVNNRTSVTVSSGTTNYTFDALNRMASVTDSSQGVTRYLYDAVGNLVETDLANNTVETRAYDNLNHLISLENKNLAGLISSYHYTLDAMGMRTAVDENGGRHVQYSYDQLHRLTQEAITDLVEGNRITNYTFDTNGNRLTRNDSVDGLTTYDYDNNDRLLSETLNGQVTTYTYDNNGNTLSRFKSASDQTNYTWDDQNRMIGATVTDSTGTHQMSYGYNSDGIRVSSVVDGQETRYLVDANRAYAEVLEEYTASGTVQASYLYGLGLISQSRAGVQSFYEKDGLGSTRILTGASGSVTDTYTYDAFGNQIASTGTTVNNYRYTGEQYDSKLGNYYLRQRYYDPSIGRFNRKDTYEGSLNQPISLHKYLYANGNPVNGTDPTGMFSMTEETATLIGIDALEAASGSTVTATTSTTLGAGTFPEAVAAAEPAIANVARAPISIASRIAWQILKTTVTIDVLLGEAIEDENLGGIPAIIWGNDVLQTTQHTFDAITGTNQEGFKDGWGLASPFLGRVPRWSKSRSWLKNIIRANDLPVNYSRDEYPYNTSIPGGQTFYELHAVSVRAVPKYEKQGAMLDSFYTKANVKPLDPNDMWFIVGTTKGSESFYIDRDGQPKTDLDRG